MKKDFSFIEIDLDNKLTISKVIYTKFNHTEGINIACIKKNNKLLNIRIPVNMLKTWLSYLSDIGVSIEDDTNQLEISISKEN